MANFIPYRRNITSNTEVELFEPGRRTSFSGILISNIHDSNAAVVDLYHKGQGSTFYVIKNLNIPVGASVMIEECAPPDAYLGVYIQIGSSQSIDVRIN